MLTEPNIRDYIRRKLGHGVVDVELTDDQLDDAINEAKAFYRQFVGQAKTVTMVMSGRYEYDGSDIADDLDYVTEVLFALESDTLNSVFDWAGVKLGLDDIAGGNVYHGGYSGIVQTLQHWEMAKAIVSSDNDWEWDETRRKLILSPVGMASDKVAVIYMSTKVELGLLTGYEEKLVQDYSLAQAMKTLSYIRGKFAEMPGAGGGFTMNSDILYANAGELEAKVEEQLRQLSTPTGFWAR